MVAFHSLVSTEDWGLYIGKKVIPSDGHESDDSDKGCELTDDEKIRLGMLLSESEVKELATKGYISHSSDEGSLKSLRSDDIKNEEIVLKRKLFIDEEEEISSNKKFRKA